MEVLKAIKDTHVTHALRTLGYDSKLGTGLSGKEYRSVVRILPQIPKPDPKVINNEVRSAVKQLHAEKVKGFEVKFQRAADIRLIRNSLKVVAVELEVNVTLATSDYPVIIERIHAMEKRPTPMVLAPILAEYIFGED